MADEVHEIQLNGKQLVFLFMATTIVAVVIFLSGVMVGRGVRAQKAASAANEPAALAPAPAAVEAAQPGAPGAPQTAQATAGAKAADAKAASAAAGDELSYYKKLQTDTAPPESLNPPAEEPPGREATAAARPDPRQAAAKGPAAGTAAKGTSTDTAATGTAPVGAAAKPAAVPASGGVEGEPPGPGQQLQVAAFKERAEAEAVAKRLKAKGYPAYVLSPAPTSAVQWFRVRVGKYKTQREADEVKRRLEKEEQFKPLFVR